MKRFQSVSSIQLDTIGRAALLDLLFTDGSTQAIEIESDKMGELMSAHAQVVRDARPSCAEGARGDRA